MPADDQSTTQIDLRKILAASLSQEAKRTVEGLIDGSIVLDVPKALEIIRTLIYTPAVKEYMTRLTLMFDNPDVNKTYVLVGNRRVEVPIKIDESRFYKNELIKYVVLESSQVWVEVFRSGLEFAAAMSINKQPAARVRRRSSIEDVIR